MPNTTKRLLAASLKRLLSGKTLDCITIQDITDDAEVSRKTFYYHFQDIYDLLSWMLREELRRVISLPITQENAWEQIGSIMTYMLQNRMLMLNVYHSVQREVLEQNIQYPMFGPDYKQRAQYSADLIHRRALEWLDRQTSDRPFLGIFTYTLPHAELAQPEDSLLLAYKGRFCQERTYAGNAGSRYNPTDCGHAEFAAMISRLDAQVGEIMAKLREKGLDSTTVVIFTSDNGPHEEGGADPSYFNRDGLLRGIKRSTYEGGIRIPFIVRWPGHVPAGTVNPHQLAFYDLMPTFCDLAGISRYEERYRNPALAADPFDGLSFLPTLLGRSGQPEHEYLYWEFSETDMMAVRMGNWKLVVKQGKCLLYDLATDLHEDHDLSACHPEVVSRMKEIIRREHTDSPLFPVTLPE